ncbi:MAG: AAA family ATPase, partial [Candidatus Limnocylindrales bacterium]
MSTTSPRAPDQISGAAMAEPVGREAELAVGVAFLDTVGDGSGPAALLLVGEAGIGKSTIWRSLTVQAAERGFRVLQATPGLAEGELAYAALGDLLRGVDQDVIRVLPEPQARALGAALLLEPWDERGVDPRSVAAGLLGVLQALARDRPVVLAIDDGQWLDSPSRQALAFTVRRIEGLSLGILLAWRGDPDGPPPLDLSHSVTSGRLARSALPGLTLGALFHLLRDPAGRPFGRSTLARIADWSGGNPLYALEIGRAILAAGAPPPPGEPPPVGPGLAVAVGDRLRGLPRDERRTLLVAAAAPRPTVELVRAACRRLRWPVHLVSDGDVLAVTDGAITFRHPLFRAQAVGIASAADRRAVHRSLAALVSEPEGRARHLAFAAQG